MYQIPLDSIPNQSVSFNVDGAYWQLHVFAAIENMCVDVYRNGTLLIQGVRCFGGIAVVPYDHLMSGYGNFIFDNEVDYLNFSNSGCNLYYLNSEEFAEYNNQIEEGFNI